MYAYDISRDCISSIMQLDWYVLTKLCGPEAVAGGIITIVTTKWEYATREDWERKVKIAESNLWGKVGNGRIPVEKIGDKAAAKRLALSLIQRRSKTGSLLHLQHEIVVLQRPLKDTEAGLFFGVAVSGFKEKARPWDRIVQDSMDTDIVIL